MIVCGIVRNAVLATVLGVTALAGAAPALPTRAVETVTHPFVGVTHIARDENAPRAVKMHVLMIDLKAPGLRLRLTPHAGSLDTIKQTTLDFLKQQHAQVAINCHFFEPWPAPNPDPGTADLVGLAASDGQVYSPFEANPPKQYAIRPNASALNIDPRNHAAIVHRDAGDPTGRKTAEAVELYNALAGNEQLLTRGEVTAGTGKWDSTPGPLTVVGLGAGETLVILIVDGRQSGVSEGLATREAAEMLRRDYGVTDAINLDGGGSTTLCMADPAPRIVNVPVGINNVPGTLRPVGSSLAIFATAPSPPPATQPAPSTHPASEASRSDRRPVLLCGLAAVSLVTLLVLRQRRKKATSQ